MKICPRCQKTYSDDNLNFCLEDGSVLTVAAPDPMLETVLVNEPRRTPPPVISPAGAQAAWNTPQQYPLQPKKSSKTWIWVVLILGMLVLVCGGGLAALFFWAASQAEKSDSPTPIANKGTAQTPAANKPAANTSTTGRTNVTKLDLSRFVDDTSIYGTTEIDGEELTMGSRQKRYYYVVVAPDDFTTDDADIRVTLRNGADAGSILGYGLIFHSDPKPLQQDYAFLIDTKRKKYRIVHHEPQKETAVINWTSSNAIKGGSAENTLEVRDKSDKMELYINGTLVNSIKNVYGYAGGVVGLYSGDGVKISFKDLELRK